MNSTTPVKIEGFIKIFDPNDGEIFVEKKNAIHYENMSIGLAQSIANKNLGFIYAMAFGNGGSAVDPTGVITYLPPNTVGQNADLYNQTYVKVVDDNSAANTNPSRNKITVLHTAGQVYTDVLVSCLLDYGEPPGQQPFDHPVQKSLNRQIQIDYTVRIQTLTNLSAT
jgi:hypothetical protein